MGDDVKKLTDISPVDSSSLLTDWLFRHKLDNISYLSAPQSIHAHITKSSRKGGIFDSRDIIRPTVQLFKNIRNKNRRRNETPSPQRKTKLPTILSPNKESNKIFNIRAKGEDALEAYRRTYTYSRVKQDKVSRDKIESAVALFRQREHEKENTAIKATPEKKKGEIKEASNTEGKPLRRLTLSKPSTKENVVRSKESTKIKEKQSRESSRKNSRSSKDNELEKEEKPTTRGGKKDRKGNQSKENGRGEIKGDGRGNSDMTNEEKREAKETNATGEKFGKLNQNHLEEPTKINVVSISTDRLEDDNMATRRSLIRSLKSKYSRMEANKPLDLQNKRLPLSDYIIVKPAIQGCNGEAQQRASHGGSVDDLLKEYRIKYRNMMKVR